MPANEKFRQVLSGSLDLNALQQRIQDGWKLVALEWERPAATSGEPARPRLQETPFGSQVALKAPSLEENPAEMDILLRMMELIIQEVPYSYVADELNRAGFRTRAGRKWSPISVFEMLPRLIDVGPAIFSSGEWVRRKGSGRA